MKTALYSVSYSGIWYKGRALSVEEVFDRAEKFGFDGVEIDGKRPHGFPLDWDSKKRARIRKLAQSKGIEIVGIAGNNNFVSPILEQRENELLMLAEQIRLCSDLGGSVVRVFLAWRGISLVDGLANYEIPIKYDINHVYPDVTKLQQWNWARECLTEGAKIAMNHGVTLALQNHPPLIENYRDIIHMVNLINSNSLKCSLDAPLLKNQTDEYVTKAVMDVGSLQVLSHYGGEFKRDSNGKVIQVLNKIDETSSKCLTNYHAFIRSLKEIKYGGFLGYELCHPVLDDNYKIASIELVDQHVNHASEFMRDLIRSK